MLKLNHNHGGIKRQGLLGSGSSLTNRLVLEKAEENQFRLFLPFCPFQHVRIHLSPLWKIQQ
jgi:hypothetical protein